MKRTLNVLAGFGLLIVSLSAVAQGNTHEEASKLRNDPTYSTRNYKHPNKATTAQRWEGATGVEVRPPYAPANRVSSYKNQAPNQIPSGGVTVDHAPNERVANRNYKAQQQKPSESAAEIARKRTDTKTTDTPSGD
ncbi:hypothetical protein [Fibrella aquatilis]|uniref:Uncharacterized protein n=1 Tax=Fibrella aquatilis TaxID=2817059 RepID=A0A939JZD1_9BACT|nr:hypothetical protein [Fibrella aquatilis]MBO0931283.1 hypothetical protein [Fibrella aquatilis]